MCESVHPGLFTGGVGVVSPVVMRMASGDFLSWASGSGEEVERRQAQGDAIFLQGRDAFSGSSHKMRHGGSGDRNPDLEI